MASADGERNHRCRMPVLSPATFEVDGKTLRFDRVRAVDGNDGVDISSLLKQTGLVTLDPGFMNTASTTSAITYIDGDAGILRYRGYPIDQARQGVELPRGRLPADLRRACPTPRPWRRSSGGSSGTRSCTRTSRPSSPPSRTTATRWPSCRPGSPPWPPTTSTPWTRWTPTSASLSTVLLMAKVPTMIASIAKRATGLPLLYPDASKPYIEDFLRMTFGLPYQRHDIDPVLVRALDMLLILHADHEQNCSTSTVRMVGSAHANIYASIAAGVGALSGPLHGGANEAVLEMLGRIQNADYSVEQFMQKVKNKEDGVRLMGFGHRVYKNYDPRAAIVKDAAHDVLQRLGKDDEPARHRPRPGGDRAPRRVLHRAQALPERGLLHRAHLQGDGLPHPDVHPALRARPAARLDRPVPRDDRRPDHQDRPPAAGVHRRRGAAVRADRAALSRQR